MVGSWFLGFYLLCFALLSSLVFGAGYGKDCCFLIAAFYVLSWFIFFRFICFFQIMSCHTALLISYHLSLNLQWWLLRRHFWGERNTDEFFQLQSYLLLQTRLQMDNCRLKPMELLHLTTNTTSDGKTSAILTSTDMDHKKTPQLLPIALFKIYLSLQTIGNATLQQHWISVD